MPNSTDRRAVRRFLDLRSSSEARCLLSLTVLGITISGCATVKPWDRDLLADPRMQMSAEGLDTEIDDHIYFSKEASSGGRGFGGGGCGCN